jgi:hypothetical protein
MRLPRVDTVSCMTAKFEPTGGCYCGEIYHEYGMDDCIFRNIVRPAFARAVCAALALSPLKLTEDKLRHACEALSQVQATTRLWCMTWFLEWLSPLLNYSNGRMHERG